MRSFEQLMQDLAKKITEALQDPLPGCAPMSYQLIPKSKCPPDIRRITFHWNKLSTGIGFDPRAIERMKNDDFMASQARKIADAFLKSYLGLDKKEQTDEQSIGHEKDSGPVSEPVPATQT